MKHKRLKNVFVAAANDNQPVDIEVANHGSFWLFHPITKRSTKWISHYVVNPIYLRGSLAVDQRYGADLTQAMRGDGLRVVAA